MLCCYGTPHNNFFWRKLHSSFLPRIAPKCYHLPSIHPPSHPPNPHNQKSGKNQPNNAKTSPAPLRPRPSTTPFNTPSTAGLTSCTLAAPTTSTPIEQSVPTATKHR